MDEEKLQQIKDDYLIDRADKERRENCEHDWFSIEDERVVLTYNTLKLKEDEAISKYIFTRGNDIFQRIMTKNDCYEIQALYVCDDCGENEWRTVDIHHYLVSDLEKREW
jgi:hypothetical protein